MFKVSNETKVGVFGALAITMLIIGYSFLKGKEFFKEHKELYAVYKNVNGLVETNAVLVNGYRIGQISKLELIKDGDDKGKILATLYIKEDLDIPKNSIAKIISADILGARAIQIVIGDGELKEQIAIDISRLGLINDVILLGSRDDAVDIMASIFDVMAFPSLYEGLPLTVVEAQAVGIPIIVSQNITREAEYDSQLVNYLPLTSSPTQWASALLQLAPPQERGLRFERFSATDFYFSNHIQKLKRIYDGK